MFGIILLQSTTFDDMVNIVENRSGLCRKLKLMYRKDLKFTPEEQEEITTHSYFRNKAIELKLIFQIKILK